MPTSMTKKQKLRCECGCTAFHVHASGRYIICTRCHRLHKINKTFNEKVKEMFK